MSIQYIYLQNSARRQLKNGVDTAENEPSTFWDTCCTLSCFVRCARKKKSCLDSLSTAQVGVRRACGDPPRVDAGEQGLGFGHCDLRLRRWNLNFCPRPTSDGRFVGCESRGTRRRAGVRGPPVVLPQVAESGRRLTRSELLAKRPYSGGHWPEKKKN